MSTNFKSVARSFSPSFRGRALLRRWVLALPLIGCGLAASASAAELDVINGQTNLLLSSSYTQATAPGTTSDVTFTNTAYSPATFTVGANMDMSTLNDLSTTPLTITNNTANALLTLNGTGSSNPVAIANGGAAADLIFLGAGSNVTIQNGSRTLGVALAIPDKLFIDIGTGSTLTINSVLSGSIGTQGNGLTKSGAGTLVLAGANTFGGFNRRFALAAGTLAINSNTAFGNAQTGFVITGGTIDNTSGSGKTLAYASNWSGNFAYGGTNDLTFTGAVTLAANRTITTNGTGLLTVGGVITESSAGFTLGKAGTGSLSLTGANAYSGNTTVTAGTLFANNTSGSATGTGAVGINSGATLAGGNSTSPLTLGAATLQNFAANTQGILTGAVTINNGAHLAPGNGGVGTLTTGNLTLATTSILDYEFNATANDLTSAASVSLSGGRLNLYQEGTLNPFAQVGTYNLIDYSGSVLGSLGSLSVLNPQSGFAYNFFNDTTNTLIQLQITAVPEPSSMALLFAASVGLLCVRRRKLS